jgi:hypothetical protein
MIQSRLSLFFAGQKAAKYVLLLLLMVIILDPIVFIDVVEAFLPVNFFRIVVATTWNFVLFTIQKNMLVAHFLNVSPC